MSSALIKTETEIQQEILSGLSRSERQVALATLPTEENPRVKNMTGAQITATLETVIHKASIRLGQARKTGKEADLLLDELNEDLGKFVNLTRLEIYQAVENGINGDYRRREDEVIFLSPANFVHWIKTYIAQTKKPIMEKVLRARQDLKTEDVPVPTEKESIISRYQLLVRASIDYTETGSIYQDAGGLLYELLTKFELLSVVDPESDAVKKAAFLMMQEAKASQDKSKIKKVTDIFNKVAVGGADDSAFEFATRIAVSEKLRNIFAGGEEDTLAFLENLKERIVDYFKENQM